MNGASDEHQGSSSTISIVTLNARTPRAPTQGNATDAGDANLMASHVFIFCCTRQRQRCAYHCTARRLPAHDSGANLLCPCPKSGSGQHSHRHAGYCTVLVPSLTKGRSAQCPLLAPAAHEPDAASVCPVAELGAIPWAASVGESRQYSANLPRNYNCHTLTLLSGRSNEC